MNHSRICSPAFSLAFRRYHGYGQATDEIAENVCSTKHDRDSLRNENLRLRGEAGLIGNNDLLRDFDRRKKEIASMQVTLEGLKTRHRTLRQQVVDISAKTIANY